MSGTPAPNFYDRACTAFMPVHPSNDLLNEKKALKQVGEKIDLRLNNL
jgi:hypothetical protein